MSGKNKVSVEEVKYVTDDSAAKGIIATVIVFILGSAAVKSGIEIGKGIADKVLRERNKDIRRQERKEKRERKERLKEEKRAKKEQLKQECGNPWQWI